MMEEIEADLFGGTGPETWANGAAVLAAALVREAGALAEAAAAMRAAAQPVPGETPDLRRGRLIASAGLEAASRAALALEAASALEHDPDRAAERIREVARRGGMAPEAIGAMLLRAAALAPVTDDAAARMAAGAIAQAVAQKLGG
jgi:hypothetical protein